VFVAPAYTAFGLVHALPSGSTLWLDDGEGLTAFSDVITTSTGDALVTVLGDIITSSTSVISGQSLSARPNALAGSLKL
jgi:hypothetical protein